MFRNSLVTSLACLSGKSSQPPKIMRATSLRRLQDRLTAITSNCHLPSPTPPSSTTLTRCVLLQEARCSERELLHALHDVSLLVKNATQCQEIHISLRSVLQSISLNLVPFSWNRGKANRKTHLEDYVIELSSAIDFWMQILNPTNLADSIPYSLKYFHHPQQFLYAVIADFAVKEEIRIEEIVWIGKVMLHYKNSKSLIDQ